MPKFGGHEPATVSLAGGVFVMADGAWVRENSQEFFIALGDTNPDYDASLFAVKNLGFIAFRVIPKVLVDIALHPRNVTSVALFSARQWLQSTQYNLFRINYLQDYWLSAVCSSSAQAIGQLSEICTPKGVGGAPLPETMVASNITTRQKETISLIH